MFNFTIQKSLTTKAQLILGAGFILFVSLLISLFTFAPASAKMDTNTSPTVRAQSYSYWKATSKCVSSHMRSTIMTSTSAGEETTPKQGGGGGATGSREGEWFDDLDAWVTVYPDGKQDCYQVMSKALKLWGWNDPKTFLKDVGYKFDSSIPGYVFASSDGTVRFNAYRDAVTKKVGNIVTMLDNSAKHILYKGIFESKNDVQSTCKASRVGLFSQANSVQQQAARNNQVRDGVTYTVIKIAEGSTVKEYIYTYSPTQSATDTTSGNSLTNYASAWNYRGSNYPGSTGEHFSCKDLASLISNSANDLARWVNQHPNVINEDQQGDNCELYPDDASCVAAGGSTCVIDGIGWIICPVTTFLGTLVDVAYQWVTSMLEVKPLFSTGENNATYEAWAMMRSVANIAFVIAFLFIIFSQLTGVGISNYGVKKMLPRLVVAAILVNISFWICAIAVDVSNIIGSSIVTAFNTLGVQIIPPESNDPLDNGAWSPLIVGALAGVGLYYATLSALVPALLAAVVAIITVFFVLALRQALIILLIVIAPLAFVAYLLPNTEDWFSKWRKLLLTLLLMFPIIAFIFGASALASNIIFSTANGDPVLGVMAAGISIIPLAITPLVMKTAGGVLNRFAGIVNNAERGPIDRLKRANSEHRESVRSLRDAKALAGQKQFGRGSFVKWRARRAAITGGRKSELNRATTGYVADQIQENEGFQNAVAGGGALRGRASSEDLLRAQASSIKAKVQLEADEVNAATAIIKDANLDMFQIQDLAKGVNTKYLHEYVDKDGTTKVEERTIKNNIGSALQTAAINEQFKIGDIGQTDDLVKNSGTNMFTLQQRQAIAEGAQSLAGKVKYYGGLTGTKIAQGQIKDEGDLDLEVKAAIETGKFSEQDVANQDKDALVRLARVSAIDGVRSEQFIKTATDLKNNERIYPTVESRKKDRIEAISEHRPFIPPSD